MNAEQKKNTSSRPVVTRVPPSPTGNLHVGTARTALFNYLFAKRHGGQVLLRMEDTDRERSKPEYEQNIIEGLAWLGISFDNAKEGVVRQSERSAIYKDALGKLLDSGAAYLSKEAPVDGGRSEVIRFKNPNRSITFTDRIRGEITFDTTELGDFVIAKSAEEPLYHLAVVVDDLAMGVTHVIRGEDGISNTPRQILLIEALGGERPEYAHIPLILAPDRSKLSKRHGAVSVASYRDSGYLPEAMVNFLAFTGWNPGGEREIFSLQELVELFDLDAVQKGGAVFNAEKLKWFNKEYIKRLSSEQRLSLVEHALPEKIRSLPGYSRDRLARAESSICERISIFGEVTEMAEKGDLDFLFAPPAIDRAKLLFKGQGDLSETAERLRKTLSLLETLPEDPSPEAVKALIMPYAEEAGRGFVLWPLRYALTGLERSPDPFTVVSILGKEESIRRARAAIS